MSLTLTFTASLTHRSGFHVIPHRLEHEQKGSSQRSTVCTTPRSTMPAVKREESPEVMPGPAPPTIKRDGSPKGLPDSSTAEHSNVVGDAERSMPPSPPKPYPEVLQAHSALSGRYTGSSPHKYRLAPSAGCVDFRTPPALLTSSRLQHVIAAGPHNKPETRAPFNTEITTLPHIGNLTALLPRNDDRSSAKRQKTSDNMAEYANGSEFGLENEDEMVMISRGQLYDTRCRLAHLEGARQLLQQRGRSNPRA
jgi:hypothetical protein